MIVTHKQTENYLIFSRLANNSIASSTTPVLSCSNLSASSLIRFIVASESLYVFSILIFLAIIKCL